MEEGQPYWQGQPSLPRSRVSVKFFVKICFRLYERRASPHWQDLAIDYRDLAQEGWKLSIFLLGGLASQSSLHTTKAVLTSIFQITFHFTRSVCLCVGYKMKTCTQISDSGFRGKINVVSPGDSTKRASPGQEGQFSPCKQ